jgi:hypothetical protein
VDTVSLGRYSRLAFFQDVKFRYLRAGGAQSDGPGGWVSGRYDRRWNAGRAQLLRTRTLGGEFVLLPRSAGLP